MLLLLASLFFSRPAPLDMPKAAAFLVRDSDGERRLEDRFDLLDLWTSSVLVGRWLDDEGRVFALARLDTAAPKFSDVPLTRTKYREQALALALDDRDVESLRDIAVSKLIVTDGLPEEFAQPRHRIRGMDEVLYCHGTNETFVACMFRPEKSPVWYFAQWMLADGDDRAYCLERFEAELLGDWADNVAAFLPSERSCPVSPAAKERKRNRASPDGERELLREDVKHSVTNYPNWQVTDGVEFEVLDNLPGQRDFIVSVTNDLAAMRRRYAEVLPTPICGSNVLAVARVYATREEYLEALAANEVEGMRWSAAYWSPLRRELVAYLPADGHDRLLKTLRHEAFHQYLSYACSMISASPWINEGYAQYFEDERSLAWDIPESDVDIETLAALLPSVFGMNYEQFYDGTDFERRVKYRLAWSVAVFLEQGAPKVPFDPFRHFKRDYVEALLTDRDMVKATAKAFGRPETVKLFVDEWKKFWLAR